MKTKWDVLFGLFQIKEARLTKLSKTIGSSPSSVRQRLKELMALELVVQEDNTYKPNKENSRTWLAFQIMKFCKNKGINPNVLLSEELAKIVSVGLSKEEVRLSDFKDLNYKTVRKYLTYLNRVNLLFVISKKPLIVKFVRDPVFDDVLDFSGLKKPEVSKQTVAISKSDYLEIESLLKKLKIRKKDIDLADVEEELKIEFASASTQLEGNTFTLDESRELILHDIIPKDKKLKEANEVKNYYNAVNYLISHLEQDISIDLILDLHRIIVYNLGVREGIRSTRVSIKGNPFYKVSHFSEIFPKLDELCKKINDFISKKHTMKEIIEFATFVHNEFQHIHPFEDGNSRTTRLIWNYVLLKQGFPLMNIYSNTREEYLSFTKLARQRNDSKLNAFLVKIIKDNLFKRLRA
ncbi:Fic family protein [Candidatus Micrarchaeota archaeon]|nr:Fic family protein [Candidatus Micrarchaeota archaeon]